MSVPVVVNVKVKYLRQRGFNNFADWVQRQPNALYIGRDMNYRIPGATKSKWHNPYTINQGTLEECLRKYEEHVRNTPELYNALHELNGKELGCWCHGDHACHGDVLVRLFIEKCMNCENVKKIKLVFKNSLVQEKPKLSFKSN